MGARINFCFKTDESDMYIYLYSHWGETTWRQDLAHALDRAKPRWSDDNYCLRIIVDQLSKSGRDEETGYGLGLVQESDILLMDYPVIVDVLSQTINNEGTLHSWEDFIQYQRGYKAGLTV
jgi:hypothetical protein